MHNIRTIKDLLPEIFGTKSHLSILSVSNGWADRWYIELIEGFFPF